MSRIIDANRFADRLANKLFIYIEAEKKKRKPLCNRGNAYHGLDGRFVNPEEEAGSFSLKKGDGKNGCSYGKSRRPTNSRKRVATKLDCGGGEADWRCKDGLKRWTESLATILEEANTTGDLRQLELYLSAVIGRAFNDILKKLKKGKKVNSNCSFTDLMKYSNAVAKAEKGDLQ
jgi:hypothetical protein